MGLAGLGLASCEPAPAALCGSTIASSRPNRCYPSHDARSSRSESACRLCHRGPGDSDGLLTSPFTSKSAAGARASPIAGRHTNSQLTQRSEAPPNPSTFPIEYVKLSGTIAPGCFRTRNSQSNYNALKIFKAKPLCDSFFRAQRNELSMNLGETFRQEQKSA